MTSRGGPPGGTRSRGRSPNRRPPHGQRLTSDNRDPATSSLSTLQTAAGIIAPLSVITSILIYFGWIRTGAIYGYFGVDQAILKLSTQDYLLRSGAAAFKPIASIVGIAGAVLVITRLVARAATALPRNWRWAYLWAPLAAGPAMLGTGIAKAIEFPGLAALPPDIAAILLSVGAALAAVLLRQISGTWDWTTLSALLGCGVAGLIGIFWATAVYADETGTSIAADIDAHPESRAAVTLYTETTIDLPGEWVGASEVHLEDGKLSYRYDGLRLLAYADGRWLVLTGSRGPSKHLTVTILPDDEAHRVEVGRS